VLSHRGVWECQSSPDVMALRLHTSLSSRRHSVVTSLLAGLSEEDDNDHGTYDGALQKSLSQKGVAEAAAHSARVVVRRWYPNGSCRRGESHPPALAEPDVRLSPHPARVIGLTAAPAPSGQTVLVRVVQRLPGNAAPAGSCGAAACISASPTARDDR
jgi:hypothetical protein